jgi:tetratricopeptide (TPR) repeat protein
LLDAVLSQRVTGTVRRNALTVLARLSTQRADLHEILVEALIRHFGHCVQDVVAVATETTGHLPRLAEIAFTRLSLATKSQVSGLLSSPVVENSVQLAELNCLVKGYVVEKWRQKQNIRALSQHDMANYGDALGAYSSALGHIGRHDQALECARQCLETCNKLWCIDRAQYDPVYARSLSNYARHLSEVGRTDEALEHAKQALEIRRRLAQAHPGKYEPAYATSLDNYAGHLRDVGRSDEIVRHAKMALELRRRLAHTSPDLYEPVYATTLSNYAIVLGDVGQSEQAVEHGRLALEIRRRLAQTRPDRYDSNYAMSLNNYASHLSEVGRTDEALEHAKQAVAIYQRLSAKRPERFDDSRMNVACFMHFLSWLCDQPPIGCVLPDPNTIPETILPHRRPVFILYAAFVQGCLAADEASRADAFKRVDAEWRILPLAGRTAAREYWLCAAAWCCR